jgi:actin beta/gamma 1
MSEQEVPAIIIDNGSYSMKAGLSNHDEPSIEIPTLIGYPRLKTEAHPKDYYIGSEAQNAAGSLKIKQTIQSGIIIDWDDIEKLWHYLFEELTVSPNDHRILLTEPPLNPKHYKEKMAQIMFESFGASRVYVAVQAALSLFSVGRTSGVVLDSGYDVSHVVPIHNGEILDKFIPRFDIGGSTLTYYLIELLEKRGYNFTTRVERKIISDIKEKLCYVANDLQKELNTNSLNVAYELPDGQKIQIIDERIKVPELYFQPSLVDLPYGGLHEKINETILKCNANIQKNLYSGIVLSGGSTMYEGFPERLEKEMTGLVPQGTRIKVIAPQDRKYMVWRGASVLANHSVFQEKWVTKQEYNEIGVKAIHKK